MSIVFAGLLFATLAAIAIYLAGFFLFSLAKGAYRAYRGGDRGTAAGIATVMWIIVLILCLTASLLVEQLQ